MNFSRKVITATVISLIFAIFSGATIALAGVTMDWVGATALNKFGVATRAARAGKMKLFAKIPGDESWEIIKSALKKSGKAREQIFEDLNALSDEALDSLLQKPAVLRRVVESKNASRFIRNSRDPQRYIHEFLGDETGGWHYFPTGRPGNVILNKIMGKNGVYKADVQIKNNGVLSPSKQSTFFPDDWSEEEVLEAINEAYEKIMRNKQNAYVPRSRNSYRSTVRGIEIELYIDQSNDSIISAFIADIAKNGF